MQRSALPDLANSLLASADRLEPAFNLRDLLRSGQSDEEITEAVRGIWSRRTDRYSDLRSEDTISLQKVEMSKIGG